MAKRKRGDWTGLGYEDLLDLRFCDLQLQIKGTALEQRIERLYEDLKRQELKFRPHCWLSDEWFTPDGIPGIAIPFYLAHPRLMRLERRMMLEVEGGTEQWCLKILRHEAGHAIDNAFRLHRRRKWREMFGRFSQPYPESYHPRPYSKSFVLHLDPFYAQSHPAEDFAETFAVWLRPRSKWRTQYEGWPALRKLEYVDQLMGELAGQRPPVRSRSRPDSLRSLTKTLREHYDEKRKRYAVDLPEFHDRELRRLFSDAEEYRRRPTAASFLRRNRRELRRVVARLTGQYRYTVDQVLQEMIDRCQQLRLRLMRPEGETRQEAFVVLTVQTMNYLHHGHHEVAL